MMWRLWGAAALACILASGAAVKSASAQSPPPASTRFQLSYSASILNVVTLGTVTLRGGLGARTYSAAASVETAGLAALFDDTRIRAATSGAAAGPALSWARYDLSHAYAAKFRRVAMTRAAAGVSVTATPDYGNLGAPPASAAQKSGSHDPISALLTLSRQVGGSGACTAQVRVFDGKQHYGLALMPLTNGQYRGGGYTGRALVCRMRFTRLAGFPPPKPTDKPPPLAEIWFAQPSVAGFAAPLRIEVPTPAGPARLDLSAYSVSAG